MDIGVNWGIACNWILEPEMQWICILKLTDNVASQEAKEKYVQQMSKHVEETINRAQCVARDSLETLTVNGWLEPSIYE